VNRIKLWARLSRTSYTPVIILPVIFGNLMSVYQTGEFNTIYFIVSVIGAFFAHIGANTVNDYYDYKYGTDDMAETRLSPTFGGSDVLTRVLMSPSEAKKGFIIMYLIALICGIYLTVETGFVIILIAGIGFLLGYFYVAPPLRFAYFGKGLGEIAIFISFGILPVLGGYYVQSQNLNLSVILASLPFAFYTTAIVYNHHFTHWRGDKKAGKNSPVVILGESTAQIFSWLIIGLSYITVMLNVILEIIPLWSVVCILTAPIIYKTLVNLDRTNNTEKYIMFAETTAKTNILTGSLINLGLIISFLV